MNLDMQTYCPSPPEPTNDNVGLSPARGYNITGCLAAAAETNMPTAAECEEKLHCAGAGPYQQCGTYLTALYVITVAPLRLARRWYAAQLPAPGRRAAGALRHRIRQRVARRICRATRRALFARGFHHPRSVCYSAAMAVVLLERPEPKSRSWSAGCAAAALSAALRATLPDRPSGGAPHRPGV